MRMQLYNLNWPELDPDNRKLVYLMLVGCTPERGIKIGSFDINLESFSKVRVFIKMIVIFVSCKFFLFQFLKICFSFCAVLIRMG